MCTDGFSALVGSSPEGRGDGMKPAFCGHVLCHGRMLVAGVVKFGSP